MKNYGFTEDLIELGAYILDNRVPKIPHQLDGNWEPFLPTYEPQAENYETSGCTVWGSQNQIETFYKRVYGVEPNYSERFTYILAGIQPDKGGNPQAVYDAIRKHGLIDNRLFPVPKTLDEFTDPIFITGEMVSAGKKWLNKHELHYELLWKVQPKDYMAVLKEHLTRSPLGVSVTAWRKRLDKEGNLVYTSDTGGNNHYCLLYKFDDEGYPWIFDSYDHSKKRLSKDHNIRRAYAIHIQNRTHRGLSLYVKVLKDLITSFKKKSMDLATLCESKLGTDVSPRDNAPDELACAESATMLMREIYPETPIEVSTRRLYLYLISPTSNWIQTDKPQRNALIISPTGYGKRGTHGHVGICLDDKRIASNKSATGKLETHLDVDYWLKYYGGMNYPTLYFIHT